MSEKHRCKITLSEQAWLILRSVMLVRKEDSASKVLDDLILKHLPNDSDSKALNYIGDRQFRK